MAKFTAVGVLNTAIDAAVYFTLTRWFGFSNLPILAKAIAYAVGMVNGFFWNQNWTFEAKVDPWAVILPFMLTQLAALGINAGMMTLCLQWLTLPELIALGVATATSFAWNFFVSKSVVFQ
jgi:putative flippase GtrA